MVDGAEYTGRTVDDAIAAAEEALGASRNKLSIEVVSQGSRGVFGIGAEQARIRASLNQPAQPSEPEPVQILATQVAEPEDDEVEETPVALETETPAAVSKDDALPEEGQRVLQEILTAMGIEAQVSVREPENPVVLGINGRNLGVLIGRRGDNLAALQFMVNLILSKNRRQWPRVVLDVENYRARREESLRTLADRIAYRVQRNGRPFTLEAMPAGDRRIIHLTLRDRQDVETYSIGEGPARRVVVAPKRAH